MVEVGEFSTDLEAVAVLGFSREVNGHVFDDSHVFGPVAGTQAGEVVEETEALTGRKIERTYVDKGYVGHDALNPWRVFKSGQKRGVHGQIKKEQRRRSAIEAVIGHCKAGGHLGRNFLKGRDGDQINAVGYNLRFVLKWLGKLLRKIIAAILVSIIPFSILKPAS